MFVRSLLVKNNTKSTGHVDTFGGKCCPPQHPPKLLPPPLLILLIPPYREGDERDIGVGEELPHTVALVRFHNMKSDECYIIAP